MTGLCVFALKIITNHHMISSPVRWGQRSNEAGISSLSFVCFFRSTCLTSAPMSHLHIFHILSHFFCILFHKMFILSCLSCQSHLTFIVIVSSSAFFPFSPVLSEPLVVSLCLQCKFTYGPLCSLQLLSVCVSRRWPCLTLPVSLTSSQTPTDLPTQAALSSCLLPSRLAFFIDTNGFTLCPLKTQE